VETKTLLESPGYCCLSHYWGQSQPVILTTTSYQELTAHFPVNRLPQTFREAIDVCRWLGVDYLWIDSLCITQDSSDDWKHEASRMGLIYKHAELTIAATDGQNSEAGLYRVRIPAACVAPLGVVRYLDSIVEHQPTTVYVIDQKLWIQGVEEAPLNQRTWVLQVTATF
jgi:hypothetical protein